MRVLLTADVVGGVLTWAVDLIAELTAHGDDVWLITFGGRAAPAQRRLITQAQPAGWLESELALEWMPDPWADLEQAHELLVEFARALHPDVVHLSGYGLAAADLSAPVLITAHSDVWSWWRAVHHAEPPSRWDRYRRWVRRGLASADAVVAPTAASLAELRSAYGPWPGRALVIHNGTADCPGRPGAQRRPRAPVALAAGRLWDECKNLAQLRRAAERLPSGAVRLAGDLADTPDVAPAVALGALAPSELARERRAAAVFTAPARYEPFGLAILEAARDGCALVLGDIPSLRELWDGHAQFVAPDDLERLVALLRALLDDPRRAAHWGDRARTRAVRYGRFAFGQAHRRLYAELRSGALA